MLIPALLALQSLAMGETCPAPLAVEARVRTILHLSPARELTEAFLVERHEAGLYVELRRADDTVIGQRLLPGDGTCDELAQAAAVVLAAWLSDVHPDFAGSLPEPAAPRLAEPEPEPPPAPRSEPAPPLPAPAAKHHVAPRRFELDVGAGADLAVRDLAPQALLGARYAARGTGFGVSALALVSLVRSESLPPGHVDFWRWPLVLAVSLRVDSKTVVWDLDAGPLVAWLHLAGRGFDHTGSHDAAVGGGFLGLRLSGKGRTLAPFLLGALQFFPAKSEAYVDGLRRGTWGVPRVSYGLVFGARFFP